MNNYKRIPRGSSEPFLISVILLFGWQDQAQGLSWHKDATWSGRCYSHLTTRRQASQEMNFFRGKKLQWVLITHLYSTPPLWAWYEALYRGQRTALWGYKTKVSKKKKERHTVEKQRVQFINRKQSEHKMNTPRGLVHPRHDYLIALTQYKGPHQDGLNTRVL